MTVTSRSSTGTMGVGAASATHRHPPSSLAAHPLRPAIITLRAFDASDFRTCLSYPSRPVLGRFSKTLAIEASTSPAADDRLPLNHRTRASFPRGNDDPLAQPRFDAMYDQLAEWKRRYYTTVVPRNAPDAQDLAEWVSAIRRLGRKRQLPEWALRRLEALHVQWEVDTVTAKWHANFHSARGFKATHGGDACDVNVALPPDFRSDVADWEEAARWVDRQRDLYRRQKLTNVRVRMLKEVLGLRLSRSYAPLRKNMHAVLRKENAAFKREMRATTTESGMGWDGGGAGDERGRRA
jgi:hypothetical protein